MAGKSHSRRRKKWLRRVSLLSVLVGPLALFNLTVSLVGGTFIFPLSPYFLAEKFNALKLYSVHRARCLWRGHEDLEGMIAAAEKKHGIPKGLLAALVEVESGTRVHRISPAGAMGPGQLMPATAADLGVLDPFSPKEAIDGSARYLAAQLRHFHSVTLALAAYNAGPGSVRGMVPRNGETEFYVQKVLREYQTRGAPTIRSR